jgi:TonB family protein
VYLAAAEVRRVELRNLGQIVHCYEQGLRRNPHLRGRFQVRLWIGPTGSVTAVNVTASDDQLGDTEVHSCIRSAIRQWQFPAPNGPFAVVVAPFSFEPPN